MAGPSYPGRVSLCSRRFLYDSGERQLANCHKAGVWGGEVISGGSRKLGTGGGAQRWGGAP